MQLVGRPIFLYQQDLAAQLTTLAVRRVYVKVPQLFEQRIFRLVGRDGDAAHLVRPRLRQREQDRTVDANGAGRVNVRKKFRVTQADVRQFVAELIRFAVVRSDRVAQRSGGRTSRILLRRAQFGHERVLLFRSSMTMQHCVVSTVEKRERPGDGE
jgi:hypothetical protein